MTWTNKDVLEFERLIRERPDPKMFHVDDDGHVTKWYTVKPSRGRMTSEERAAWHARQDRITKEASSIRKALAQIEMDTQIAEFARMLEGVEPMDITGELDA